MEKITKLIKPVDIIMAAGLLLVALGIGLNLKEKLQPQEKIELVKADNVRPENEIENDNKVTIDIAGEVIHPGIYRLDRGARVGDLLMAAGGLSVNADREWTDQNINRAGILIDGQKIFIPSKTESGKLTAESQKLKVEGVKIVSLNNASIEDLDSLTGVGPNLAQKIIDYRKANNGFKNLEEIKLVPGIGEKMYLKIKDQIAL